MANARIGGLIEFKIDGETFLAKGNFTYSIGTPKKEMIAGSDQIHGFKELPTVPYIEGALTDTDETDLAALQAVRDATVTLSLANGKAIVIEGAVFSGDATGSSEEGELAVRFEGLRGREIA